MSAPKKILYVLSLIFFGWWVRMYEMNKANFQRGHNLKGGYLLEE